MSAVLLGSVLDLPSFMYLSATWRIWQSALSSLQMTTSSGGAVGTHRGRVTAQRDLGRLQEGVDRELVKFNKDRCDIMHV